LFKTGPIFPLDVTFHKKQKGSDTWDSAGYDVTQEKNNERGFVVFEKATTHIFKEYIDGLESLIKYVKEIKSLITGKETDKEIQKIWSLVDEFNFSDFSFKGFVRDFNLKLSEHMSKDGWNKDTIELVSDFIENVDMSFTDLRASLSELGMSNEHIKEFMNSSSYKKILSLRKFSEKMNNLHQKVVAAQKYAANRKNIEKLSKTIESLESEANSLAKQITK